MKKLFFLIIIVSLFACSSDDEDNKSVLEQNIVNKWVLDNRVISDDNSYVVTDCIKQSSLEFFADGSFERKEYAEDENDNCNLNTEQTGEWSTNGFNALYFDVNDERNTTTADIGNLIEPLLLETDSDGEYLLISNFTETNQIIEVYKKSN